MLGKKFGFFLVVLYLFSRLTALASDQPIVLTDTPDIYVLDASLEVLTDPTRQLSISDVIRPAMMSGFKPRKEVIYKGFDSPAYWIRFKLEDRSSTQKNWFVVRNYVQVGDDRAYFPLGGGRYIEHRVSNFLPFYKREYANPKPIFLLPKPIRSGEYYYLRSVYTDLFIKIYSQDAFSLVDHHNQLVMGLVYGMLLLLIVYNLAVFFSLRDPAYLYYILFVVGYIFLLFIQRGQGFEYIWPRFPSWQVFCTGIVVLWIMLAYNQFTRTFFLLKAYFPRLDLYLKFLLILNVILIVYALVDTRFSHSEMMVQYADFFALVEVLSCLLIGIYLWHHHVRSARYYVLSWVFVVLSVVFTLALSFDLIGGITIDNFVLEAGITGQAILLSAAFMDKITLIRRQKDQAALDLKVAHAQLEDYVLTLEDKVKHRTAELSEKNEILNNKNEELESANSQIRSQQAMLIQHEKLAILGDLTASMAHEISTPLMSVRIGLDKLYKYVDQLRMYFDQQISREDLSFNELFRNRHQHYSRDIQLYNTSLDRIGHQLDNMKSFIKFQKTTDSFNLNDEIETTLNILHFRLLSSAEVLKDLSSGLPMIPGNAAQFNQVFMNLIKNAVEAAVPGVPLRIAIRTMKKDHAVLLEIEDNGQGLSPDVSEKLCKEKFSTKQDHAGLGLWICKEVLDQHQGTIQIASQPGQGTIVRIVLLLPSVDPSG